MSSLNLLFLANSKLMYEKNGRYEIVSGLDHNYKWAAEGAKPLSRPADASIVY